MSCNRNPSLPVSNPCSTGLSCSFPDSYPVGMGYVPTQNWENPYPMEQGFQRGTIFASLDYPFMKAKCRR